MIKRCGEEAVRTRGGAGIVRQARSDARNRGQGEKNRLVATERFREPAGPLIMRPDSVRAEFATADHHTTTTADAYSRDRASFPFPQPGPEQTFEGSCS